MKLKFIEANPELAHYWYERRKDPTSLKFNPFLPSTLEKIKKRLADTSADWTEFEETDTFFGLLSAIKELSELSQYKILIG